VPRLEPLHGRGIALARCGAVPSRVLPTELADPGLEFGGDLVGAGGWSVGATCLPSSGRLTAERMKRKGHAGHRDGVPLGEVREAMRYLEEGHVRGADEVVDWRVEAAFARGAGIMRRRGSYPA
jgi:hypothetical protein